MSHVPKELAQDFETIMDWGVSNLNKVIAIDSQSDENSTSIPSSEGQKVLSAELKCYFEEMGYQTESDDFANLLVRIPSNKPEGDTTPSIAMMVHLDTSLGTFPIPKLLETPAWDGSKLSFPENDRLHVTTEVYPETAFFVGQDLLHGTGVSPVGLDNKLGMCEIMTLAQLLHANPEIPHGEIFLVFRPDEEIGRMEAVVGLADTFVQHGIRYGYTIDGLEPFEINVENFNASRARVDITGKTLELAPSEVVKEVALQVYGVKSHGATAKAEGHRNTTVIFTEAMQKLLERDDVLPVDFATDPIAEVNAKVTFWLRGNDDAAILQAKEALTSAFEGALAEHRLRGATIEYSELKSIDAGTAYTDEIRQVARHIQAFFDTPGVAPLLSEHSEHYEGYTNPYFVERLEANKVQLHYRVRAFTPEECQKREEHLESVCAAGGEHLSIAIQQQYVNMGPALASFPELVTWAKQAAEAVGVEPVERPIRGGTGVDPFLDKGVPIANLGTGYFAPESEKEFTSRQILARHVLWLLALVQGIKEKTS